MSFFQTQPPVVEVNMWYLTARMLGIVGTGFASGAMLSTTYFTMPGLTKSHSSAEESVKTFHHMSTKSAAWLSRAAYPAAIAFGYAAYCAPSHAEDWINPRSLYGIAAAVVGFSGPYSYFKMSGPGKRLDAGGAAVEVNAEKKMGLSIVDDATVREDLKQWTEGNTVRGWLCLAGFLIGSYVEVFWLK